jgi:hypothetical protein
MKDRRFDLCRSGGLGFSLSDPSNTEANPFFTMASAFKMLRCFSLKAVE